MKWLWAQLLVVLVLLFASAGEATLSYFFDYEGTTNNSLAASEVDQSVAGQPLDGLLCNQTDEVSTILYSDNLGPTDFQYGFAVANATGTLCSGLWAEVWRGGGSVYNGPLLSLLVEHLDLPAASNEELQLALRLAPAASEVGTCQFDTVWLATQLTSTEGVGFSDTEAITHFVSGSGTGIGGGCVPPPPPGETAQLHLSKAISGDSQGFKLSDFSYRVTGNGIDAIVPHNHTIALPVGIYTIEEIVPEGFVKEDWRIGWYGQCKRGSTFTTTIKIDDGNIDHGTLYCQADNQYRPVHSRAEEPAPMVESASVVATTTTSTEENAENTTASRDASRPPRTPRNTQTAESNEAPQLDPETESVTDTDEPEAILPAEESQTEEPTSEPEPETEFVDGAAKTSAETSA